MGAPLRAGALPAVLALTLNAFVWGVSWWPLRQLHEAGLHPLWATALVYAAVVVVIGLRWPQAFAQMGRAPVLWVLAAAAGCTNATFNWGVIIGDVVRVVLLFYLMPLWSVLLARLLLHERLSAWAGLRIERLLPVEPLVSGCRIIDSFYPVARGGTACIPGPFGSGKAVLQQLISRYANADIIIIAACGERAGEVVETLREFPTLEDPYTGKTLIERTIIICKTSSMPVAAREASIYTAITLGEYYRQMGLDVLLLADSTSRWAQALREMSGRLDEIPGEEAFPAYLQSRIAEFYERAGFVRLTNGKTGAVTVIGTVCRRCGQRRH